MLEPVQRLRAEVGIGASVNYVGKVVLRSGLVVHDLAIDNFTVIGAVPVLG